MSWSQLREALFKQEKFSRLFFKRDEMSIAQKQEQLKSFVLSLHSEATGIIESVNYKDHRLTNDPVDIQKILYKSVDAYRYLLAILNLWGIDSHTFIEALEQKDDFLHCRHEMRQKEWSGEPIVLFDMDDVIAEFRESFCKFCSESTGGFFDPESPEYYNVSEFKKLGLNSEEYFRNFMDGHGFKSLKRNQKYFDLMTYMKNKGYWIQIVTARPESNLTAFYDTYSWIKHNKIPANGITFTPEKFVWLTKQSFYSSGKYFAVDDSSKHAAEYSKHGVHCLVPEKSYNKDVSSLNNVVYVPSNENPVIYAESLRNVIEK